MSPADCGSTPIASVTYAPPPIVTAVYHPYCANLTASGLNSLYSCPVAGNSTTLLTIIGTGFGNNVTHPVNASSICSTIPQHDPLNSDTKLTCYLASVAVAGSTVAVAVDSIGGSTSTSSVTIKYNAIPVVTSLTHSLCHTNSTDGVSIHSCPINGTAIVTVIGTGFGQLAIHRTLINICNYTASYPFPVHNVTGKEQTMLTCILQAGTAGSVINVSVTSIGGVSIVNATSPVTLTYNPVPVVLNVTHPVCVNNGTSVSSCPLLVTNSLINNNVTIIGTGFGWNVANPVSALSVCTNSAIHVAGFEDTRLTCTLRSSPAATLGAPGNYINIVINTIGGTSVYNVSNNDPIVRYNALPAILYVNHLERSQI